MFPRVLLVVSLSLPGLSAEEKPAPKPHLFPAAGRHHYPIATKVPDAQAFFDQGMTFLYGFNHDEAVRSFERAAELDPNAPMPHWGIAMALGPNYNRDIDPIDDARRARSYRAAQKAVALGKDGPNHERALAGALARRYAAEPKQDTRPLEINYSKAMHELSLHYPDDLDVQTLYADSLMVLNPWKLWDRAGTPAKGTDEILRVLERVLQRDPDHIGANHLYIHAIEASPWPERGLPSADRLLRLVPWQGHLVHMPAHIYIHTGDHERGAKANELGIRADEDYFKVRPERGLYRTMYYSHNLHFLAFSRMAQGNSDEALKAAQKLAREVEPVVQHMPPMEGFLLTPTQVLLRGHRWEDVLKLPAPAHQRRVSRAFWHFARGMAQAGLGRKDDGRKEARKLAELVGHGDFPRELPLGANTVEKVFAIATLVLDARLTEEIPAAVEKLEKAVRLQDELNYGEPPDWYAPLREALGAALLRAERLVEAETVFREDLKRNRRNPRALFGLARVLEAQKKEHQARLVDREFQRVWKGGALKLADY